MDVLTLRDWIRDDLHRIGVLLDDAIVREIHTRAPVPIVVGRCAKSEPGVGSERVPGWKA